MSQLSQSQIDFFHAEGYLLVEDAVAPAQLAALRAGFDAWVEDSRAHDAPWGETVDGRARFDVEPGHRADRPALRRVNSPTEISAAYDEAMRASRMTDCVAELIGPAIRFHTAEVGGSKPPAPTIQIIVTGLSFRLTIDPDGIGRGEICEPVVIPPSYLIVR